MRMIDMWKEIQENILSQEDTTYIYNNFCIFNGI